MGDSEKGYNVNGDWMTAAELEEVLCSRGVDRADASVAVMYARLCHDEGLDEDLTIDELVEIAKRASPWDR